MVTHTNNLYSFGMSRLILIAMFLIPHIVYSQPKSFRQLLNKRVHSDTEWYGYKEYADDYTNRNDFSYHWDNKPEKYNLFDYIRDAGFIDGVCTNIVEGIIDRRFYRDERRNLRIFLSQIDSLNVINYDNDTIYLFQHDGEFLLESRNHKVISGRKYPYNGWRNDINVFMSITTEEEVQIGWLPEYMRQALISNNRKMLHTLCLDYETNESYYFNISNSHGVDTPNPHLVFHKIVISNGKITERTKFDFEYFDVYQYRQAQLYALEQDAIQSNRVIDKAIFNERVENSALSHLLDSLDEYSYYSSILRKYPKLKEWEKRYVIPMIDSLCRVDMHSDTLYYYLEASNNSLFNTAKFYSNHSRLYLHEIYNNKIIWDTIKYDVEDVELDGRINGTQYDQMYESYELFCYPMRTSALPYLFHLANHIRWYYDYETHDFRKMYGRKDSKDEILRNKKLNEGEKVSLFYRIEVKDGEIVDIVNDMLYHKIMW